MADSSPVLSNNGGNNANSTPPPLSTTAANSPSLPTVTMQRSEPPKNLRGLNKPKCIKCGNVARSRCPYQSCKSCCSKAQNPCHIHVLKPNATLADRGAATNSTSQQQQQQQQQSEMPSSGPSGNKVTSLRQLSSTFSQFNNVHVPLRSRKPVTRKEALAINSWRFAKLKEYKERNIEAENEAFDRYMHNISLLEEIFDVNSERPDEETSDGEKEMITELKLKLRSNPLRVDKFRRRIQQTVDQGLRKLQKYDDPSDAADNNLSDETKLVPAPKVAKTLWIGKTSALVELNDRLNKAQNEEELKQCIQLRSKIRGQQKASSLKKTEDTAIGKEQIGSTDLRLAQESDVFLLKLVRTNEIDQEVLNSMDSHFTSLEEIEDL